MELEAGVLLEAEEQAHLIKTPCVLECGLAVWTGKKVRWQGPGWYRLVDGVPTLVEVKSPDPMKATLKVLGAPVCRMCLGFPHFNRGSQPKPLVEDQTQKRADRIDMVYLEGKDENGEPTSLALLPEEIRYLQEAGPDPYISSDGSGCPHLTTFVYDGYCCVDDCEPPR